MVVWFFEMVTKSVANSQVKLAEPELPKNWFFHSYYTPLADKCNAAVPNSIHRVFHVFFFDILNIGQMINTVISLF